MDMLGESRFPPVWLDAGASPLPSAGGTANTTTAEGSQKLQNRRLGA